MLAPIEFILRLTDYKLNLTMFEVIGRFSLPKVILIPGKKLIHWHYFLVLTGQFWIFWFSCHLLITLVIFLSLLVKEQVLSGFNASCAVILMSRTDIVVEKRKFSKIPNWRHNMREELVESLGVPQQAILKCIKAWRWFRSKEIGFRTS